MCTMASDTFYHNSRESHVSEYRWNLHNFSSLIKSENSETQNESTEKQILSDVFISCMHNSSHSHHKWQLRLFPNGQVKNNSVGFVSIYLYSLSVPFTDFKIPVEWQIIASSSSKVYKTTKSTHTFENHKANRGYTKYIDNKILLKDLKKGNDILTIVCKLSNGPQRNFQLNLSKDVGSLLEMEKHCDVILKTKSGTKHNAHKAILSCRSKVFSAMFEHNMKENLENVVKIQDLKSNTLKHMLHFIYTGKIKNREVNFQELFIAADKYELDDLKEICIDHLGESINIRNFIELFEFSKYYNIDGLKLQLSEYFSKHKQQVIASKGLKNIKSLSRDTVAELLYISATYDTTTLTNVTSKLSANKTSTSSNSSDS